MHILLKVLLAVIAAFIVASLIALLKIGSSEILRFAEQRWKSRGVISVIILWVLLLPIMMLISILTGLYIFLTVKKDYTVRH